MTDKSARRYVICDECWERHEAEYSHEGQWDQGAIYAVVCGEFTDYYQESVTFTMDEEN